MGEAVRQVGRDAAVAFAAILTFLLVLGVVGARRSHAADGHALHHDFYKTWMQPGGTLGCCNAKETDADGVTTGDCYPTEAKVVAGHWTAKRDDGVWIEIPDSKIIRERNPNGQDAHLCYNYGLVLCFVPPDSGS